MRQAARTWIVLLAVVLLAGCQSLRTIGSGQDEPADTPAWKSVRLAAGRQTLELRSGQVAVTDSGGPMALFFSLFAADFSPFVHSGILVLEDGRPFVYETFGRIRPWFGRRPTDLIHGKVERTPLADFIRRGKYVEIYDLPPGVDAGRVTAYVRSRYARQTPFDPHFRFDEHEALYCTELTAMALVAGGWQTPELIPFPDNPSLTRVRHWLGIDDRGTVQAQQLIEPERFVAALSILSQQARFHVYIELKRELHRRFTADQALGNLFEWNGRNLVFRQPVQDYIVRGLELYRGRDVPSMTRVREDIRALAVQMFGRMEDAVARTPKGPQPRPRVVYSPPPEMLRSEPPSLQPGMLGALLEQSIELATARPSAIMAMRSVSSLSDEDADGGGV